MKTGAAATPRAFRVLELFSGIGGCAAALAELAPGGHHVAAAIDISSLALGVYRHNFPDHTIVAKSLESLPAAEMARFDADLWWLSPPCQPYTRRGRGRDDQDPRARPLLALIEHVATLRPRYLALENVPGFETSRCHARLLETLGGAAYDVREGLLCPSELGWPNRRRRYYLLAARGPLQAPWPPLPAPSLAELLDAVPEPGLEFAPDLVARYRHALSRVRPTDPTAVTACFTAAYGRSPVRSGSYLETEGGLRRFSPREVLALLGFPESFRWPADLPREAAWRLAGNSLSLPAVRRVLAQIPELSGSC
ncbi:MAG: DNA cytosine methyltransferase [Acidobacteria bacterium]|nr:DNA cytosine methyltransferase [Acidobacteriota bacterium]